MRTFLAQVDISNNFPPAKTFPNPGILISVILKNVYTLAGVMLLVLLIFGGLSIIMGAGQNDPKKAAAGKRATTMAVVGFFVVFGSFWIIKLIEYITGVHILNPGF